MSETTFATNYGRWMTAVKDACNATTPDEFGRAIKAYTSAAKACGASKTATTVMPIVAFVFAMNGKNLERNRRLAALEARVSELEDARKLEGILR